MSLYIRVLFTASNRGLHKVMLLLFFFLLLLLLDLGHDSNRST